MYQFHQRPKVVRFEPFSDRAGRFTILDNGDRIVADLAVPKAGLPAHIHDVHIVTEGVSPKAASRVTWAALFAWANRPPTQEPA